MLNQLAKRIERNWYQSALANSWLLPLWLVFVLLRTLRTWRYGLVPAVQVKKAPPVWVVGNITVGGTGKTPLLMALVERAQARGFKPGIISRGYGGAAPYYPFALDDSSTASDVGDEPLMLFQRLKVPVVVAPKRAQALALLAKRDVDIVFSDDGLQHYALARQCELVVVDGKRDLGNGWSLPIGPLRESASRLQSVDVVAYHGRDFHLLFDAVVHLKSGQACGVDEWLERIDRSAPLHALAGIGHPERFFNTMRELLTVHGCGVLAEQMSCHAFADHYRFDAEDITMNGTIVMTEKDAVKCRAFADERVWYLKMRTQLSPSLAAQVDAQLTRLAQLGDACG